MPLFKQISPFGLDIGYTSVRAVQLEKKHDLIHLKGYGEIPIGKDVISRNKMDTTALAMAIKQVMETSKIGPITSKHIVCGLPESDVFVKILQFQKMPDSELEEVIKLEIEKIVPFSISELYLDWERVKNGNEKENEKDSIIVVAAPQKLIHNYLEATKKAGLDVIALEIEPAAVCRALIKSKSGINEAIMIVDIGADITSLTIYDFGSIQLTGGTHVAGNSITEAFGEYLKLDFEKAEQVKRHVINSNKKLHKKLFDSAIKPVLSQLGHEITRSLNYYNNIIKDAHPVSKIIFCGGNAHLPGLTEYFQESLDFKTGIGNPWENITIYPLKAIPKLKASIYTTAIGLALREITD